MKEKLLNKINIKVYSNLKLLMWEVIDLIEIHYYWSMLLWINIGHKI